MWLRGTESTSSAKEVVYLHQTWLSRRLSLHQVRGEVYAWRENRNHHHKQHHHLHNHQRDDILTNFMKLQSHSFWYFDDELEYVCFYPDGFGGQVQKSNILDDSGKKIGLRYTIIKTTEHDAGCYECELHNKFGKSTNYVSLHVELIYGPSMFWKLYINYTKNRFFKLRLVSNCHDWGGTEGKSRITWSGVMHCG